MDRWFRNRRLWLAVVFVVAATVLISLTSRTREVTPPEHWVLDLLSPFTRGVHGAVDTVRETADRLARLQRLYEDFRAAQAELDELRRENQQLRRLLDDYDRLRALLDMQVRVGETVTGANVIGRNPDQWLREVILDVGSRDGVRPDMVAVDARGVVGRVMRVSRNTSTLMLLTDPQSGVGVMVSRTRATGVATGRAGEAVLDVRFFSATAEVAEGDQVVTSQLSQTFPPGLPVGEVISVSRDAQGVVVSARIRPVVDMDHLSEVLILESRSLPAGTPLRERF